MIFTDKLYISVSTSGAPLGCFFLPQYLFWFKFTESHDESDTAAGSTGESVVNDVIIGSLLWWSSRQDQHGVYLDVFQKKTCFILLEEMNTVATTRHLWLQQWKSKMKRLWASTNPIGRSISRSTRPNETTSTSHLQWKNTTRWAMGNNIKCIDGQLHMPTWTHVTGVATLGHAANLLAYRGPPSLHRGFYGK